MIEKKKRFQFTLDSNHFNHSNSIITNKAIYTEIEFRFDKKS